MNKLKYLLLLVCVAACFTACKKDFNSDKQFRSDTTAIRKFVNENNIPAIKHESGIFYQIIAPGAGTVSYTPSTNITSDYEGRLLNGSIFDSTKGTPITFALGQVIEGWRIGIPLIQKGGKIRLIIPSGLGYGNKATGPISENSILDFTITLTNVQ